MTAKDFLKELPEYSKIFDLSIDYQYTEEQLILFAEMYHKKQVKKLNIDDVSKPLDGELQEALNEFSKTQGIKKPTKNRF